jgi:hypothetical protein
MVSTTNQYDVLIAIVPSLVIGFISIMTLIYSNRRQDKFQQKSFRLEKIERLYEKLVSINGRVIAEISKYKNDPQYYLPPNNAGLIIADIEKLKVESMLYFGMDEIVEIRYKCEKILKELYYTNGNKDNIKDGEYDNDGNERFEIVPSTLNQRINEYEDIYDRTEEKIENLARIEVGISKRKRRRFSVRPRHPWLGRKK